MKTVRQAAINRLAASSAVFAIVALGAMICNIIAQFNL